MSAPNEIWQVVVNNEIYDTDLETLKKWIADGRILPKDKVKKAGQEWQEAGQSPFLRSLFAREPRPKSSYSPPPPPPQQQQYSQPQQYSAKKSYDNLSTSAAAAYGMPPPTPQIPTAAFMGCQNHPDIPAKYICRICSGLFCKDCPKNVGTSNVMLCPSCGDLCQPYEQVQQKAARQFHHTGDFGLEDFKRAITFPLNDMLALVIGAVVYGVLLMGYAYGRIAATVIMFGCISLVIKHVSAGRMDRGFVPDLSNFSMWDDVVVPLLLGLGVTIITWGPLVLVLVALSYGLLGGPTLTMSGTPKEVVAEKDKKLTREDMQELINSKDPKKDEEIMRKIQGMRPTQDVGVRSVPKADEKKDRNDSSIEWNYFSQLLQNALPILIVGLLAIGWAIFYYPMALAIAGFTQDFWSVINPLVGLDTIKRMGAVYFKAFAMYIGAQAFGFGISFMLTFSMMLVIANSTIGKLFGFIIGGIVSFYINLVIACILGLSLYKCAEQLDIAVD
jgi:hypothetical protein